MLRTSGNTRREILLAGVPLMFSQPASAASALVAEWTLDESRSTMYDSAARIEDPISSRAKPLESTSGISGPALRFDGYSVWVTRPARKAPELRDAFTLELWVAIETYPVTESAFLHQHRKPEAGYCLGLNELGFWGIGLSAAGGWHECQAPDPFPKNRWVHLAATFDAQAGIVLYLDGQVVRKMSFHSGPLVYASDIDLEIGRSRQNPPMEALFETAVINGILDQIRIYGRALGESEIRASRVRSAPSALPDLAVPRTRFADDPHRPIYHAIPPAAWTNEPHGLIRWRDQYHLFYQKNANGPYMRQIHWGHMASPDLVHWEHLPIALSPEKGPDARGCWSGSALVYRGTPSIVYTGGNGRTGNICLATSKAAMLEWSKCNENPVIPAPPNGLNIDEFRDPYTWEEDGAVYMIIGSGIKNRGGTALLYRSTDLTNWKFLKPLLIGDQKNSGRFWEMPVFCRIGDRHILIVCEVPGRASYWIGSWKNETFTPDRLEPRRLDLINHFLSPAPYVEQSGRLVAIGIVPETRASREVWKAGWAHTYGLPRVFSLGEFGTLRQEPAAELNQLRGSRCHMENLTLTPDNRRLLEGLKGDTLEILAQFEPGDSRRLGFRLRCSPDAAEETLLYYDSGAGTITLDRSRSSLNPSVQRIVESGPFELRRGERLTMRIYLDRSVLEAFVNDRGTLSTRVYPTRSDSTGLDILCDGGTAMLRSLDVWNMKNSIF